ncbi:DUF6452 family protein [Epilithonimonas sp. UC225_85]|uniref:DUF6452 family protein n=1 Tax=Epilithonimonas sp. UC225_85 TaxID=3350167 RepID=UPI0036D3C650
MKNVIWIFGLLLILTSCGSDDDICLGEESTPRLKLKFHNVNQQLIRLDTLYVDVDYGKTTLTSIITAQANVDSVFVPLRIDESPYTDVYVRRRLAGPRSKIRVTYDTKSIYVSPACGFKINYENLKTDLLQSDPVLNVEPNHTSLTDESKINFYLRF